MPIGLPILLYEIEACPTNSAARHSLGFAIIEVLFFLIFVLVCVLVVPVLYIFFFTCVLRVRYRF